MKNINISIIVPVYNVEQYLEQCLNSLVNQSLKDIEIIVVIDGATDNSLKIAKKYEEYSNFLIVESENRGLGAARNLGLKYANGEYILFVDSDDFIDHDMCRDLYICAKEYNSNIIQCGHQLYYEEGKTENILYGPYATVKEYDSQECLKMFFNGLISGYVWNKLYRHDFIKKYNIKNPEGVCYEDMIVTLKTLNHADKVIILNKPLYIYRQRLFSLSKGLTSNKILDYINQARDCISYTNCSLESTQLAKERKAFNTRCFLSATNWYYKCKQLERKSIYLDQISIQLKKWKKELPIFEILSLSSLNYKYKILFILEKLYCYKFFVDKRIF